MRIKGKFLLLLLSYLILMIIILLVEYFFKTPVVLLISLGFVVTAGISVGYLINKRVIDKIIHIYNTLKDCNKELYDIGIYEGDELSQISRKINHSRECLNDYVHKIDEVKSRYRVVSEGARDVLWDWNLDSGVIELGDRWWDLIGIDKCPFDLLMWQDIIHNEDIHLFSNELNNCLSGDIKKLDVEYRVVRGDGSIIWILTKAKVVFNNENPIRIGGSHTDITSRKILEQKMVYNTYYDPLTELPNKFMLFDRLKLSISRVNRKDNYSFTLLYLDFDGFKHINDSYGHIIGDKLLVEIAARLQEDLRPLDLVSRIGSDEFAIILDGVSEKAIIKPIVNRILIISKGEFNINGKAIFTSVSVGIVSNKSGDTLPEELLQKSDIAMYNSKIKGKGCYTFFKEELREKVKSRWSLEHELHKALGSTQLQVYYQPIMDNCTNSIYSFEALLRWNHPTKGMISPGEFIPAAEETGFITNMTKWLINEICKQAVKWNQEGGKKVVISFNVTAKDFLIKGGLDRYLVNKIESLGCSPHWIALEVTESVMIQDFKNVTRQLQLIRSIGIKIKLDDFGTGYSSLSYLNRFQIDYLKIDKSFIESILVDETSKKIVKAVILLAKDMGYKTIAEGVEKLDELELIKEWGCDFTQGYFYSKPLSVSLATDYLLNFSC